MFIYVCYMTHEKTSGVPGNTDITSEMRNMFLSLDVNTTKCYECGKSNDVVKMEWENSCMWFVCPACKKA